MTDSNKPNAAAIVDRLIAGIDQPITEALVDQLRARAAIGLEKYGVTLDRQDIDLEGWLQHMLEELLDGAGYAMAAMRKLRALSVHASPETWMPMKSAPRGTQVVRLCVESEDKSETRVFAAVQDFSGRTDTWRWLIATTGGDFSLLDYGWRPIGWARLDADPAPRASVDAEIVREYIAARDDYKAATSPPNPHAGAPRLSHGDPRILRYSKANAALTAALKTKANDDFPACSGDPASCPENEGRGCCKPNPQAEGHGEADALLRDSGLPTVADALRYSENFAEANLYLTQTAKDHILGLCKMIRVLHPLAKPAADAAPQAKGKGKVDTDRDIGTPLRAATPTVSVEISGAVGIGKSALALLILDAARAAGLTCEWADEFGERNLGTGAEDIAALDVRPRVVIHERIKPAAIAGALAADVIALAKEREDGYRNREHGSVVDRRVAGKLFYLARRIGWQPEDQHTENPRPCSRCGALTESVCGSAECGNRNPSAMTPEK